MTTEVKAMVDALPIVSHSVIDWKEAELVNKSDVLELVEKLTALVKVEETAPIPLTADWLERCGCKKLRDGMYRFDRFDLRWVERYKFWNVTEIVCQAYITKVEFVHEWQNVVAVLNGYELKFKTK